MRASGLVICALLALGLALELYDKEFCLKMIRIIEAKKEEQDKKGGNLSSDEKEKAIRKAAMKVRFKT